MRAAFPRVLVLCSVVLGSIATPAVAERLRLAWPTANMAYARGESIETYIQPTQSGRVESGLYGCTRNSGTRFHEGIDLLATEHDSRGEALDEIFSILDGVVRYVNAGPGLSSYGRYVVVEHDQVGLPVYTLYSHLASITPGIEPGVRVRTGQTLGIMGRSAGARPLPKSRAHLHFEIGVRLTDNFQSWYNWKKFGSKNDHGLWNGMNLTGIDPLEFYNQFRAKKVNTFLDYWKSLSPAVTVRYATSKTPDFVKRYPALRAEAMPLFGLAGWEIEFDRFGVPLSFRPLVQEDVADFKRDEIRIVRADRGVLNQIRCKDLVRERRGKLEPDSDLMMNLQLLLGIRR